MANHKLRHGIQTRFSRLECNVKSRIHAIMRKFIWILIPLTNAWKNDLITSSNGDWLGPITLTKEERMDQ